jgi:SAM-dependent methyltransferase
MILTKILMAITRQKSPVLFNDMLRAIPVSSLFGSERGTPVDRYYIDRFLLENASLIFGDVLEVGSNDYTRRFGGARVSRSHILHTVNSDVPGAIVADLTDKSTLPVSSYDCFICTQTLNFIFDVQSAVEGALHLLKPGGVFLGTVAGISQISRYDMDRWGDYWRLTTASVQKLFEPVFKGGFDIVSFGNVLAATAFLQGVAVEDFPEASLLNHHDPDYQILIGIIARKGIA